MAALLREPVGPESSLLDGIAYHLPHGGAAAQTGVAGRQSNIENGHVASYGDQLVVATGEGDGPGAGRGSSDQSGALRSLALRREPPGRGDWEILAPHIPGRQQCKPGAAQTRPQGQVWQGRHGAPRRARGGHH
eukprot:2185980-Pyramimonas_sp.AAC.1